MSNTVTVDGVDLGVLGFHPLSRDLPTVGEKSSYQVALGRAGGLRVGANTPPGSLTISGHVVAPDRATALERYRKIIGICRPGAVDPVTVQFSDMPDVRFVAHLAEGTGAGDRGRQWLSRAREVTLKFDLVEPYAQARQETTIATVDGAVEDLPLGNGPSHPVVLVIPTANTVTIEVLSSDADEIRTLTWEGDAGAGHLEVDAYDYTATQDGTNVLSQIVDTSVFPVLKPNEGAAKIRITGGDATVKYRKKYWV